MSKNIKIKGLKKMNTTKREIKSVEKVNKPQSASMSDLFDNGFMLEHTNGAFSTFEAFITASFPNTSFSEIPENELDSWVDYQTDYSSWKDFQVEAEKINLIRQLEL